MNVNEPRPLPVVAIISNSLTPYRLHFHRRLIREAPQFEWHSLLTHDVSNSPWSADDEVEIRPVRFGVGERSDDQSKLARQLHEYRKGGSIIRWLKVNRAQAVVLLGYNDAARLRIIRWCHRHRIPCLLFGDSNIRGDLSSGAKGWLKRRLLRSILRRVDAALVCGSLGRAYFQKYGMAASRIFYMPYEPDYAMVEAIAVESIRTAYSKRGLSPDGQYIIYCGRLAAIKRVDLLIRAFAAIADDRPDWQLLVVGDGPERDRLMNLIPTSIRDRVHFAGFSSNQKDVAALQRGAKILALPSDFEPWGVVINEAVAAGLAVVASDQVGAAAELVHDQRNGGIFPAGNLAALTQSLLETTSPAVLAKYCDNSVAVLREWRASADPVAGLLKALAFTGLP